MRRLRIVTLRFFFQLPPVEFQNVTLIPPKIRRNTRWWNSNWFEVAQLVAFSVGLIWLTVNGANQMGYNWQWYHMPQYFYKIIASEFYWGPLIEGLLS